MDKWDYIQLISKRGDPHGYNGGVYDLLEWSGKTSTFELTEEEVKEFFENWPDLKPHAAYP